MRSTATQRLLEEDSVSDSPPSVAHVLRDALTTADRREDEGRAQASLLHDLAGLTGALLATTHQIRSMFDGEANLLSVRGRADLEVEISALEEIATQMHSLHGTARRQRARTQPPRSRLLSDIVDGVVAVARCELPDTITISTACPPGLGVGADPLDVCRIVLNLVRNAVQAMDGARMAGRVFIQATSTPSLVEVRVTDEGPGVPPALAERIFEHAFTSRAERGGQGLGLAICRDLAERHGGELRLEPGARGACFVLRLPRETSAAMADCPSSAPSIARSFFRDPTSF